MLGTKLPPHNRRFQLCFKDSSKATGFTASNPISTPGLYAFFEPRRLRLRSLGWSLSFIAADILCIFSATECILSLNRSNLKNPKELIIINCRLVSKLQCFVCGPPRGRAWPRTGHHALSSWISGHSCSGLPASCCPGTPSSLRLRPGSKSLHRLL